MEMIVAKRGINIKVNGGGRLTLEVAQLMGVGQAKRSLMILFLKLITHANNNICQA